NFLNAPGNGVSRRCVFKRSWGTRPTDLSTDQFINSLRLRPAVIVDDLLDTVGVGNAVDLDLQTGLARTGNPDISDSHQSLKKCLLHNNVANVLVEHVVRRL